MSRKVRLHREAHRFLQRLPSKQRRRIIDALFGVAEADARQRTRADIKRLKGTGGREDLWRFRVGPFRVVYAIRPRHLLVTSIFPRGRGYRP